jgi:hypothetical protein
MAAKVKPEPEQMSLPGVEAAPAPAAPEPEQPAGALATIMTGTQSEPPRVFLYGVHGIGKSTFGASFPSPIFIPTEDGANEIDVPKFPQSNSLEEVLDKLRALYKEKHSYRTVVIDSADWLENFITKEIGEKYTEKELAYGREAMILNQLVGDVLSGLNFLRKRRGMACVVIAHSQVKRFDSPLTEPYDRYQPKLAPRVSALFQEWADAVFFTAYDVSVKAEEVGFNQKVRRGIGSGDRLLYTEERPAFYAKNRYAMPPELPLSFDAVAQHLPYYIKEK